MTPRELNKRIQAGEIWYFTITASLGGIVKKAVSVKGIVKITNNNGFSSFVSQVRKAGSNHWVPLTAEGVMTWAIN